MMPTEPHALYAHMHVSLFLLLRPANYVVVRCEAQAGKAS